MANIAIVTSTSFGANNAAAFNAGFGSSTGGQQPQTTPFPSDGNYDLQYLKGRVRAAANTTPDLIVTAGGLITAQAAAAELTRATDPKFIFLSGYELSGPNKPPKLAGGVNMNNPGEDTERKRLLQNGNPKPPFNVPSGKIYLVVNSNAPMAGNDANPANWPPPKVAHFFPNRNPTTNTNDNKASNHFVAEFHSLAQQNPTPEGLVISADPYFRLWRTALIIALADQLPVPVCYPFQDFIDAIDNIQPSRPNRANSVALDLPPLNNPANANDPSTAYFQLGKQAGRFVADNSDVQIVTWEASNKAWSAPKPYGVQPKKS
jgi:hypothetical protein